MNAKEVVSDFINAFEQGNYQQMENLLALDLVSYVTNAKAGLDKVQGRDAYMKRVLAMNIPAVKPNIIVTQMAEIKENQILVMVEIKAKLKDRTLHNYAAHLINTNNNKITEMWMVEALPEYSDEFWK